MYQRMYIDIVFMTNFLMDYMLLRLVGKFLHLDGKRRRCVISAAFGSFVSCRFLCRDILSLLGTGSHCIRVVALSEG